jgi:DNA end-binding protein Ku
MRSVVGDEADQSHAAARITLRPHDPGTGEEVDKAEVVKGYEYSRGQFVTFTAKELKGLDVESSKVIDLEKFVPRNEIDPVYFDSPYYVYPDGPIAVETIRVIGAAMAGAGVAGIGRLTLSRRERMVMVDPRGTGMALFTLRSADEVRVPQFPAAEGDLDPEMVAIAGAIIRQRTGNFDPSTYHDRYQQALRELIEAKMKGRIIRPREVPAPTPVIDLMAALKSSLAKEVPAPKRAASAAKKANNAAASTGSSRHPQKPAACTARRDPRTRRAPSRRSAPVRLGNRAAGAADAARADDADGPATAHRQSSNRARSRATLSSRDAVPASPPPGSG